MNKKTTLKRCISLPYLSFYGLGTILGAGIYVLVGKVAGESGGFAPLAFLIAGILATFTALSYGEISARLPRSAGEVAYVQTALKTKILSIAVGLFVILSGIVSIGTLSIGFSGYLQEFFQIPTYAAISGIILIFGLIAIWGISESVILVCIITILGIGGLIFIIFIGGDIILDLPGKITTFIPKFSFNQINSVLMGAFLAFYAFIGFEDMVNVAEEVKNPKRNLPLAIIIALITSTFLYLLVAIIAQLSLPLDELTQSTAPLARIVEQKSSFSPHIISAISLVAIANGILVQIIMASRVLYGMSDQKLIPKFFSKVNSKTQTPIRATIVVIIIALALGLYFPITSLANATSFFIICVFVLVNISLWILKKRNPRPKNVPHYPLFIPIVGTILSLFFVGFKIFTSIY